MEHGDGCGHPTQTDSSILLDWPFEKKINNTSQIDGGIKCGNELTVPLKENRNKHLSAPGRDESILKIKLMGIIIKENIGRHKKFKTSQS